MAQHQNGQYIGTNLTLNEVQVGLAQNFRENLNRNSSAIVDALDNVDSSINNRITQEVSGLGKKIEDADEQIYQDMIQIKVSSTKPEDAGVTMKVGDFWFDSSATVN